MKKTITIIFVVFLIVLTPINGLYSAYCADATEWQNSDLSVQAKAFLAYCKSNNLIIEGSGLDVLTSWTTDTYYKICNQVGINPTELQAEIKYMTDGNLGLKFLFTNTGATAMNRIFSAFLQNNTIDVDSMVDKTIYSGKKVTDLEGYKCYAYVVNNVSAGTIVTNYQSGGVYRYDNNYIVNASQSSGSDKIWINYYFYSSSSSSTPLISYSNGSYYRIDYNNLVSGANCFVSSSKNRICVLVGKGEFQGKYPSYANMAVIYDKSTGYYYSGFYFDDLTNSVFSTPHLYVHQRIYLTSTGGDGGGTSDDVDITVDSDGDNITNNDYSVHNYTTINNNGDTYYYDTEPTPQPTPSDPSDDPNWRPTQPIIPPNNPDQGDNTIIDLPDIDIPDLPSLDFSLGDLRNKFPFSIPFDIIALLGVLDGEPQAPVIDAHIPFGTWFDWHFEADFSRFDDTAALIRSVEFIGFCIGLIYITIRLVKG